MNREKLFACVLLSIVAVAAAAPIRADTIGPFTTTTPIPSTLTDWSATLAFPQFDPSYGILTSVELAISGEISTIITVANHSAVASSGAAKTECLFTVQDLGGNLIAPQLDLSFPTYAYSLLPGSSITSGTLTQSGSNTQIYTSPIILGEFTGLGSIVLNASTFTQTLLANTGGNTYVGQVTTGSAAGTVTYNFTHAPEPGSLAMLGGLGLMAFWCVWRRRG